MAGRIGCVKKPDGRQGLLKLEIGNAGLNHGIAAFRIHSQDAVQTGQTNNQPLDGRNRPTGKIGSKSARHERYAGAVSRPHDPGHLMAVSRKNHNPGFSSGQGSIIGVKFGVGA